MSYISGSGVYWRIKRRQNYETTIYGSTCNINKQKGGKLHWGGNTTIHRSASIDRNITRGDGDRYAWIECCSTKKMHNYG